MKRVLSGVCLILAVSSLPAAAQSRPLRTEDAETVPAGHVLFEAGFDYLNDITFPAAGLTGNLTRIGTLGFSFGVSSIAEIQIDGGIRDHLSITARNATAPLAFKLDVPGDSTSDFADISIGAKVRFVAETATRPSFALRFATKLPNASNESGLGLDTTDFHVGLALAKTAGSVRFVTNFGLGILADPVRGDRQNDVVEYGLSVARAVYQGVELVGELNGRLNTRKDEDDPVIGTESRSLARLGARLTRGPVRLDGAMLLGITKYDPAWGFTTGITWVFRGFEVP
jgi:hypothetical protein